MSTIHSLAHHRLLDLYPNIDPAYLSEALASYDSAKLKIKDLPIGETVVWVDDLISVFRRKVCEMGGVYPTVVKKGTVGKSEDRTATVNRDLSAISNAFPFVPQQTLLDLVQHPPPNTSLNHSLIYQLPAVLLDIPRLYVRSTDPQPQPLPKAFRLRSRSYIHHVELLLIQQHPTLSKSQIRAVGLEVNWEYTAANAALEEVARRLGWAGRMIGGLRAFAKPKIQVDLSECSELSEELWEADREKREFREKQDAQVATDLNRKQYEYEGQTIECVCCFDDVAFEDGTACSSGCFVCHACVNAQVTSLLPTLPTPEETVDPRSTLIPCPAAIPPCPGSYLPESALQAVLPQPTFALYKQSFHKALLRPFLEYNHEVSQCPACPYFVLRPLPSLTPFWEQLILMLLWPFFLLSILKQTPARYLTTCLRRIEIRRSTSLFRCPDCKTTSCRICSTTVHGFHRCGQADYPEDERQALRIAMEQAMADSLKRVCPQCEVAFVKTEGCNHMRCRCGAHMCYVCRADIKQEGYKHFCPHFREDAGGPCPLKCGKCELYHVDSDEVAAQAAARKARSDFLQGKKPTFKDPHGDDSFLDQQIIFLISWVV